MSLNKLTDSSILKPYLNIGCNDIKCSSLQIGGNPISGGFGFYTPTITVSDSSNISNISSNYSISGISSNALLDVSLYFKMVAATSSSTYIFTISLPENYLAANGIFQSIGNIHHSGGSLSSYNVVSSTGIGTSNNCTIVFNQATSTLIPVGSGENFVNINFKIRATK